MPGPIRPPNRVSTPWYVSRSCRRHRRGGGPTATSRDSRTIPGVTTISMRAAPAGTSRSAPSAPTASRVVMARRRMWTAMRPERGFTLLETLLALAIGGLVLTASYTAVVRAAAARDGATRRTADVARARLALLEIARTIESASAQPFRANAGEVRIALGEPEPRLVRFALDDSRLVEDRTIPFAAGGGDAAPIPGSSRVLLDGVQAFSVRCFGDGAWTDGWRGTDAPRAVELTIRVADGEELRTRIVLALSGAS